MVAKTEAEKAIVVYLVKQPHVTSAGPIGPSGWTSSTGIGGPGADPSTIEFQMTRTLPTCQMHSVSFTNHRGIPMGLIVRTWQNPDGSCVVAPVGGGSPGRSRRTKPWVNFTAGFDAGGFTAGGHVEGTRSDEARMVRLTFADGFVLEDAVDNGIVLFFEPRGVIFPADAEIFDDGGRRLANYKAFDDAPFIR